MYKYRDGVTPEILLPKSATLVSVARQNKAKPQGSAGTLGTGPPFEVLHLRGRG